MNSGTSTLLQAAIESEEKVKTVLAGVSLVPKAAKEALTEQADVIRRIAARLEVIEQGSGGVARQAQD